MQDLDLDRIRQWDARLVEACRSIKVLSTLAWPSAVGEAFLEDWRQGRRRLPEVCHPKVELTERRAAIEAVVTELTGEDPLSVFLRETGESYLIAARMLESAGTPAFNELGKKLYGAPNQLLPGSTATSLQAAERFLEATRAAATTFVPTDDVYCIPAQVVAEAFRTRIDAVFTRHPVAVEISGTLASKAAAGGKRVRLRGATCYSADDISQLIQHELLVHTLTALNGREQPNLHSLGLGAPRTTLTQEGIAVFAELINHTMDLNRLRRIALRPIAIHRALEGADFIEVFQFFLDNGQNERDSYQSTARVFRGGDVQGGVAFLKDGIYLRGLLSVHNFLRKAFEEQRFESIRHLFAGRLALPDVLSLAPYFRTGFIAEPLYEPEWVTQSPRLAAFLMYADFVHGLDLGHVELGDLTDLSEGAE